MSIKTDNPLRALFFYGSIEDNYLGAIMAEVYKDHVYRPYLPFNKKSTVALDIGGHIGIVSLYLSKYFERVITLEPSKEHFDALKRNIASNNAANVKPINKALYIREGKLPFGGPEDNKTMRSLHMATWPDGKSSEVVTATTIDKLFEQEKIERVDLLKLDIEGSEVEVVSSTGFKKVARKIELIVGERHEWSGRHQHQLDDALKNNGFTLEEIPNDASLFVARRK